MLVTMLFKFITQRCFMRFCARYDGDVVKQIQFTTLLYATLCMLC
jgi:hypothetical protein